MWYIYNIYYITHNIYTIFNIWYIHNIWYIYYIVHIQCKRYNTYYTFMIYNLQCNNNIIGIILYKIYIIHCICILSLYYTRVVYKYTM